MTSPIKFTGLPVLSEGQLNGSDLLAIVDTSATASKQITMNVLAGFIYSSAQVTINSPTLISGLNSYLPAQGNSLNATKLWYGDQYRSGDYFLNYTNFSNKPVLPTDISDLNNKDDYVSLSSNSKLEVKGTAAIRTGELTTNNLSEGSLNKYYTDPKVLTVLNANFGELFNLYSNAFDGGAVTDSLVDVNGTFQNIAAGNTSNKILITDITVSPLSFKAGQRLRLYGARQEGASAITDVPTVAVAISSGFKAAGAVAGGGNPPEYTATIEYRVAYFDLQTGEIGQSSTVAAGSTVTVATDGVYTKENLYAAFNDSRFVTLTINANSTPAGKGILVYRKTDNDANHKLIAVLGSKDLGSPWADYHTYDATAWSGKNPTDNTYSTIAHFPLEAPTNANGLVGWTDVEIDQVEAVAGATSNFTITLTGPYTCNANGAVQICHNDTTLIQNAITTKNSVGIKSVNLNAKTYNVSTLSIPNNFGLVGVPNITKVRKLPFTGYINDSPDNALIKSSSNTNATGISFSGVDFDGNILNQYLVADVTDKTLNYLVTLGINPISILIDTCRFKNMIGGGIAAESPSEFKMNVSEVVNSGLSDRYEEQYSPLIVDAGSSTLVTGNRFENFPHHIDASVTQEGVFTNNVIKACGSGLFLYGATFVVSSPNILIGAANEFLSTPDVLNSEYDSINIPLARFAGAGDFLSDPLTYQENGAAFDITYTDQNSANATIVYRANLISNLSNGDSQIYGNRLGPAETGVAGRVDMPLIEGKRYRIGSPGNTDWRKVGAVANIAGIEFIAELSNLNSSPTLEKVGSTIESTTGHVTSTEFVGYMADASTQISPIAITNVPGGVDGTKGEFKFTILSSMKDSITSGVYSQGTLRAAYDGQVVANNRNVGSKHTGIGWSASVRRQVSSGSIQTVGSWASSATVGGETYRDFSVQVTDPKYISASTDPLIVGSHVIINNKSGFSTGLTNADNSDQCDPVYGVVQNIGSLADGNRLVTIRYYQSLATNVTAGAGVAAGTASGTLNIIDDFIMAQGLIK